MAYNNKGQLGGQLGEQPRTSWGGHESNNSPAPGGARSFRTASARSSDSGSQTRQPTRGGRWLWDPQHGDYVQKRDGQILKYTEYQRNAANLDAQATSRPGTAQGPTNGPNESLAVPPKQVLNDLGPSASGGQSDSPAEASQLDSQSSLSRDESASPAQSPADEQLVRVLKPYESPLDTRFRVVEKPKRFFAIGRIFKTVWFEPGAPQAGATANPDVDWAAACPQFHGEKPFAKFRWFLVVRKRLHHSLCFAITTFGGRGATKASRGRARDFVVLYPALIEPPEPWEEEGIVREPIAVIIEEGQQFLSPAARLDCGRIYTVEDNLRVMKIGRVHPDSLDNLEKYYQESVG